MDMNFNISLENALGVVAFVGLGEPEIMLSDVEADPANSTAMARATTYGYVAFVMVDHDANPNTPDQPLMMDLDDVQTIQYQISHKLLFVTGLFTEQ